MGQSAMGSSELLTVEEFAKRLKTSRTTVFTWKKKGWLVKGRHYIQLGRKIWFPWGPELINKFLEDNLPKHQLSEAKPTAEGPKVKAGRRSKKKATAINFNY